MTRPRGQKISPEQIAELERRLLAGEVPAAAADAIGVGRRSAWRIARRLKAGGPSGDERSRGGFRLGGSATDRRVVALTAEVTHLRKSLRQAHQACLDDDAVRQVLGRLASAPTEPPEWLDQPASRASGATTPEVPVTIWSDWHLGEVVSRSETNGINAFDPAIAEARVSRLVDSTIRLCRHHGPKRYPGIVVNLLGDFVSGGLHPELAKTDAEEMIPSALRARDLLVGALDRMRREFGRVYVPCTSGNHGRATPKPEFKRYSWKNFDFLIYQLLARHFEALGQTDIRFDIPDSNEVHYRVYGQRYLAMHGDMLGVKGGDGIIGSIGPIMRGEVKVGKQSAAIGRDYDVLLMGHWHQPLWLPRAIVANSLKGFDEYAKNALRAPPSEPSQPLWFVHPRRGITSRWDVKVEDPALPADAGWVSWPERAAA